jgi:hypothetical protein
LSSSYIFSNSVVENQWNSSQHLGRRYKNIWGEKTALGPDFEELFPQEHDLELAQVIHVNTDTEIMIIVGM